MTIVPTVVCCLMEGVIDAKSIKTITDVAADIAEKLAADSADVDVIEQVGAVGEALVGDDESDALEESYIKKYRAGE